MCSSYSCFPLFSVYVSASFSHRRITRWRSKYIYIYTHTHTHTHIYIYIYVYICIYNVFLLFVFPFFSVHVSARFAHRRITRWWGYNTRLQRRRSFPRSTFFTERRRVCEFRLFYRGNIYIYIYMCTHIYTHTYIYIHMYIKIDSGIACLH